MSAIDSVISNYKAAVDSDNQWWAQRVAETTQDDDFRSPVFQMGDDAEPYQPVEGTAILDVCHNGVPSQRRFNCGPPAEP